MSPATMESVPTRPVTLSMQTKVVLCAEGDDTTASPANKKALSCLRHLKDPVDILTLCKLGNAVKLVNDKMNQMSL